MNKIFKVVFNKAMGVFTATSELARSKSKKSVKAAVTAAVLSIALAGASGSAIAAGAVTSNSATVEAYGDLKENKPVSSTHSGIEGTLPTKTVSGDNLTYDQFEQVNPGTLNPDVFAGKSIAVSDWTIGDLNKALENRALQDQLMLKDHIQSAGLTEDKILQLIRVGGTAPVSVFTAGSGIHFEMIGNVPTISADNTEYIGKTIITDATTDSETQKLIGGNLSFAIHEKSSTAGDGMGDQSGDAFMLTAGAGVAIQKTSDTEAKILSTLRDTNTLYSMSVAETTVTISQEQLGAKSVAGAKVLLSPYNTTEVQQSSSINLVGDGEYVTVTSKSGTNGESIIEIRGSGAVEYQNGLNVTIDGEGHVSAKDTTYQLTGSQLAVAGQATFNLTGHATGAGADSETTIEAGSFTVKGQNGVKVTQTVNGFTVEGDYRAGTGINIVTANGVSTINAVDTNTITEVAVNHSAGYSQALTSERAKKDGTADTYTETLSLNLETLANELKGKGIGGNTVMEGTLTDEDLAKAPAAVAKYQLATMETVAGEQKPVPVDRAVAMIDTNTTYQMEQTHNNDANSTTITMTDSTSKDANGKYTGNLKTATIAADGTTAEMKDGVISVKSTTFGGNSGTAAVKPGEQLDIVGGETQAESGNVQNITVTATAKTDSASAKMEVKLNENISVTSVTATTVNAGDTTINNNGVTVGENTKITKDSIQVDSIVLNNGGPEINEAGIDMNGQVISHVADGVESSDAINVSQLMAMRDRADEQIDRLNKRIGSVDEDANAGVATAMAVAGLPQAYLPGKSMIAIGGATYRGEQGYAIGYSYNTESSKWTFKLSGTGDSQGHWGGMISAGYHFD